MAVRAATITYPGQSVLVTWTGLLTGDTGAPVCLADFPDKSIQVAGAAGTGGTIVMQGSNDGGTTYSTLHDQSDNALSGLVVADTALIAEHLMLVRPSVAGGDGATNFAVRLSGVKVL